MIELDTVTLQIDGRILLQQFSAKILPGECIGIFGPNGAGKSTFLKSLVGLFPVASGRIAIQGNSVFRARRDIAYFPQEMDPVPDNYSVLGFLTLLRQGACLGLPAFGCHHIRRCEAALAKVNALSLKNRLFKELSGGEKKRVLLAAMLLEDPKILLLDEPLANLDPRYQREFIQILSELHQDLQLTVLITAHDFNPLLPLLNRVMFIGQGRAVLDSPERVIQGDVLSALYQTKVEVVTVHGRRWVVSLEGAELFQPSDHCHGGSCVSV